MDSAKIFREINNSIETINNTFNPFYGDFASIKRSLNYGLSTSDTFNNSSCYALLVSLSNNLCTGLEPYIKIYRRNNIKLEQENQNSDDTPIWPNLATLAQERQSTDLSFLKDMNDNQNDEIYPSLDEFENDDYEEIIEYVLFNSDATMNQLFMRDTNNDNKSQLYNLLLKRSFFHM